MLGACPWRLANPSKWADCFCIRPLIPLLTGDGAFYVLALAKVGVRLLRCAHYGFDEIDLSNVPTSLPDELRLDVFDVAPQFHTASVESGGHFGVWHGHGDASDEAVLKQRVIEFCRHLDRGVCERLATEHAPLVLAGVETMRGFYREVNHYQNIVEADIDTNPDRLRNEELHARGWKIVEPIFTRQRDAALDLYRQRAGSAKGRIGYTIETVLPAAAYQRVETLFIPSNESVWGKYHRADDRVEVHNERQAGDVDLLDRAAAFTLKNNGNVYALPEDLMPDHKLVAALFRY